MNLNQLLSGNYNASPLELSIYSISGLCASTITGFMVFGYSTTNILEEDYQEIPSLVAQLDQGQYPNFSNNFFLNVSSAQTLNAVMNNTNDGLETPEIPGDYDFEFIPTYDCTVQGVSFYTEDDFNPYLDYLNTLPSPPIPPAGYSGPVTEEIIQQITDSYLEYGSAFSTWAQNNELYQDAFMTSVSNNLETIITSYPSFPEFQDEFLLQLPFWANMSIVLGVGALTFSGLYLMGTYANNSYTNN